AFLAIHRRVNICLATEIPLRFVEIPLGLESEPKLADCQRNARMNFSVVILERGERLAENWDGLVRSPFCDQVLSEDCHVISRFRMILPIPGLHDANRCSLKTLGVRVVTPLVLNVREVSEILSDVRIAIAIDLFVHAERLFV